MLSLPRAILFDMDGTLTEPMLDFPRIKAEMGIAGQPILEALNRMPPDRRAAAELILHRHEEHAARHGALNAGCMELLNWLEGRSIPVSVVTRNSRRSAQTVIARHHLKVRGLITREDAPHKPNPTPLRQACQALEVDPVDAWMVGDGQYDVEAANAVPMTAIWLSHGRPRDFAAKPTLEIADLPRLLELLKSL